MDKTFCSIEDLKKFLETISDQDVVRLTIETEGGGEDASEEEQRTADKL